MERPEMHYLSAKYESFLNQMSENEFHVIRFGSYRTAAKLRFIQNKTNFHLIDIWNAIEAIRDNGLHNFQDITSFISVSRLEALISSMYFSLAKRLPQSLSINLDQSIELFLSWILMAYDPTGSGKVKVFSVKIALAIMSSGKLIDKLRYIFSLISDPVRNLLVENRFNAFLQEAMALPASVAETATFQYDDSLSASIFDFSQPIDSHLFMSVFITSNSPPACISWIVILHRMAEVEHVVHPISCDACHRQPFQGFRYKCQKCFNYNICQDCFWRGRQSGSHNAESHACKEYAYWKSPTKQIGHSLRKSFRCIPPSNRMQMQYMDEPPKDKRFDLSHIVPPSPSPGVHLFNGHHMRSNSADLESLYAGSNSIYRSPPSISATADSKFGDDEEHRLISRYAAALANYTKSASLDTKVTEVTSDISLQQRVIAQLESKNREIMKEIERLRREKQDNELKDSRLKSSSANYLAQNMTGSMTQSTMDPILVSELTALRQRKEELESHLTALQDSRRQLMVQLEGLMKLLKNHGNLLSMPPSASGSASSTLNRTKMGVSSATTPTSDSIHSDVSSTNNNSIVNRDLLVAADSVTNAMSSLVKELESEDESQVTEDLVNEFDRKVLVNEDIDVDKDIELEEQKLALDMFSANHNVDDKPTKINSVFENTDDESFIRTDDEIEDLEDDRWNMSSKLWAYVNH